MVSRYELTEAQWTCIQDFLPGRKESVGRTAKDNRSFVNGVLWALRSGARWSDLPERYGQYKTVHKRFTRWAVNGVWDRIFRMLTQDKSNQDAVGEFYPLHLREDRAAALVCGVEHSAVLTPARPLSHSRTDPARCSRRVPQRHALSPHRRCPWPTL